MQKLNGRIGEVDDVGRAIAGMLADAQTIEVAGRDMI